MNDKDIWVLTSLVPAVLLVVGIVLAYFMGIGG
jgi:hypothetical protein